MSKQDWFLIPILVILALVPLSGSRFYVFMGTDILIFALFAVSSILALLGGLIFGGFVLRFRRAGR